VNLKCAARDQPYFDKDALVGDRALTHHAANDWVDEQSQHIAQMAEHNPMQPCILGYNFIRRQMRVNVGSNSDN
jgi:hypothetical protein